ncbi:putative esterase F42H10.6 [Dirofilaria immitis]|nr:putative esterase F42H10.6 [Dirofilaria immitis]
MSTDGYGKNTTITSENNDYLDYLNKAINNIQSANDFNRVARKVRAVSASADRVVVEMLVEEEHVNSQTAALVDMITARTIGMTVRDKVMVSVELAVSYLLPVKLGEMIEIEAKVLKIGRNIAFAEAEFRRKNDGRLVAKGKHTIAFIPKPPVTNGDPFEQF